MARRVNESAARLVTLKNLYRLLTQPDWPVPSAVALPGSAAYGNTLVAFWSRLFAAGLPPEVDLGFMDVSERRSRAISSLMNRSGGETFREEWHRSLAGALDEGAFWRLAGAWSEALRTGKCRQEELEARLIAFISEIACSDTALSPQMRACLNGLGRRIGRNEGGVPREFRSTMALCWLTLCALLGGRKDAGALDQLREALTADDVALYRRSIVSGRAGRIQTLTNRKCSLCAQPLPKKGFVGRGEQLKQVRSKLMESSKLLLSGMGGIGKSELARQLWTLLKSENVYQRVAFVQYQNSLAQSLIEAFDWPELSQSPEEAVLRRAQEVTGSAGLSTLLLIDNVDQTVAGDALLEQLSHFDCDILATSRLSELPGFVSFAVAPLDQTDSLVLFEKSLGDRGDGAHDEALYEYTRGNPLALTLFARLCKSRYWSVEQLVDRLRKDGAMSLPLSGEDAASLEEVLGGVFSQTCLGERERNLLRLLAMLPYGFWLPQRVAPMAGDVSDDVDAICDILQVLADLGWLTQHRTGYLMHPVIADVAATPAADCDDFPTFWKYWRERLVGTLETTDRNVLLEAFRRVGALNPDGLQVLLKLEDSIISGTYVRMPDWLLTTHRNYLDHQPGNDVLEAGYWLTMATFDIVNDRFDLLEGSLRRLLNLSPEALQESRNFSLTCNALEYASQISDIDLVNTLFERIHPADKLCEAHAAWLASMSIKLRKIDRDHNAALKVLQEAENIVDALGLRDTLIASNCDYRLAICLLDLQQNREAAQYLKRCLTVLKKLGYRDDSVTMLATMSTYAVALMCCERYDRAIAIYEKLLKVYQKQMHTDSNEYISMLNNYGVTCYKMGRLDRAVDLLQQVVELDEKTVSTVDMRVNHRRNLVLYLLLKGNPQEALKVAVEGENIAMEKYPREEPTVAALEELEAEAWLALGDTDRAVAMLERVYPIVEKATGIPHRYAERALIALKQVRGE